MVRLAGFAAINETRTDHEQQQTLEAQEARIIELYESALRNIQSGNENSAEVRCLLLIYSDHNASLICAERSYHAAPVSTSHRR